MSSLRTKFFVASLLSLAMCIAADQATAIPLTFIDGAGDDQSFTATITASGGVVVQGQINFNLRGSTGVIFTGTTEIPGFLAIPTQFSAISLGTINIARNPTGSGTLTLVSPPQSLQNAVVSSVTADLLGPGGSVPIQSNNISFGGDGNVTILGIGFDLTATVVADLTGSITQLSYQQTGVNMFNAPGTINPGPTPNNFSTDYLISAGGSGGNLGGQLLGDISGNASLNIAGLFNTNIALPGLANINEILNEAIPTLAGNGSITDLEPGVFSGPGRDIRTSVNPQVPAFIPLSFNFAATSTTNLSTTASGFSVLGTPFTAWMSGQLTFNMGIDVNVNGLAIQLQDSTLNALQVPVLTTNPGAGGTLNFGNVLVGTVQNANWNVQNTGTDGSLISGTFPNATGDFGPGAFLGFGPIGPGPGATRTYSYTPGSRGLDTLNRTLTTTDAGTSTVQFRGLGVAPLAAAAGGAVSSPGAYTLVGTVGQATTSVSNNGDGNLSGLGAISNLNGNLSLGAGDFSLVGPAGVSIPDQTTINPIYNYAPGTRGVDVENLTHSFTNGNPNGTNTAVNLGITVSGQGVAPLAAVGGGAVSSPGAFTLVGTTGQVTTSVTNNGDGNLSGLGAVSNLNGTLSGGIGEFSLVGPAGISVPDHTTINPVYDYNPTSRGADLEILTHTFTNGNPDGTNTPTNLNIVVTGQGVAPLASASGAGVTVPGIFTLVGTTGFATTTVTNSGDGNLSGLGAISNLNGTLSSGAGDFSLVGPAAVSIPDHTAINPVYAYNPGTRGNDVELLTHNFTNGNPDGSNTATSTNIFVAGQGVAPIQATAKVDAPLTRITYLTPGPGNTNPPSVTVFNNGDGNLSGLGPVSNLNGSIDTGTDARFTGGGAGFSLTDHTSIGYAINYQPTTHTIDSSTFTVSFVNGNSDQSNTAQVVPVVVQGQGVGPIFNGLPYDTNNLPDPGTTLDFGDVVIGGNGVLQLDISNITTDPNGGDPTLTDMTLLSATITGPDAVEFSLPGFVPGTVISAGGLISYFVNFDPLFPPGLKTATLTFLTDEDAVFGSPGKSYSFTLQGLAAPEPASVLGFALCTIGGVVAYRLRRRR